MEALPTRLEGEGGGGGATMMQRSTKWQQPSEQSKAPPAYSHRSR